MATGMGFGFGAFGILFTLFFLLVFVFIVGMFIYVISTNVKKANNNRNSPRLTVDAKVVSKRDQVRGENTFTYYFATFEFESGDRIELEMQGQESGMVVEGDAGSLTFQGSKFISFSRTQNL